MFKVKPEFPETIEEVLLLAGYQIHFKDEDVCSLVPKDKNSRRRPICIQQKPGPLGISSEIIAKYLFDAEIFEESQYADLLAKVKAKQKADHEVQTKGL